MMVRKATESRLPRVPLKYCVPLTHLYSHGPLRGEKTKWNDIFNRSCRPLSRHVVQLDGCRVSWYVCQRLTDILMGQRRIKHNCYQSKVIQERMGYRERQTIRVQSPIAKQQRNETSMRSTSVCRSLTIANYKHKNVFDIYVYIIWTKHFGLFNSLLK